MNFQVKKNGTKGICYPPNNELFAKLHSQSLRVRTVLDRYGRIQGTFYFL